MEFHTEFLTQVDDMKCKLDEKKEAAHGKKTLDIFRISHKRFDNLN
jgi:hypothetical protein